MLTSDAPRSAGAIDRRCRRMESEAEQRERATDWSRLGTSEVMNGRVGDLPPEIISICDGLAQRPLSFESFDLLVGRICFFSSRSAPTLHGLVALARAAGLVDPRAGEWNQPDPRLRAAVHAVLQLIPYRLAARCRSDTWIAMAFQLSTITHSSIDDSVNTLLALWWLEDRWYDVLGRDTEVREATARLVREPELTEMCLSFALEGYPLPASILRARPDIAELVRPLLANSGRRAAAPIDQWGVSTLAGWWHGSE